MYPTSSVMWQEGNGNDGAFERLEAGTQGGKLTTCQNEMKATTTQRLKSHNTCVKAVQTSWGICNLSDLGEAPISPLCFCYFCETKWSVQKWAVITNIIIVIRNKHAVITNIIKLVHPFEMIRNKAVITNIIVLSTQLKWSGISSDHQYHRLSTHSKWSGISSDHQYHHFVHPVKVIRNKQWSPISSFCPPS